MLIFKIFKIFEILFSTYRCTFCIAPLQKRDNTPDVDHHQHNKTYTKMVPAPDVGATSLKRTVNRGGGVDILRKVS